MKNKSVASTWIVARLIGAAAVVALGGCAGSSKGDFDGAYVSAATPTVDYVERLDVYSAPHKDSFLNQLAMNYRSYAIYNARTSGYPDMGELFAQKAVAAFSGELPFPESLSNWPVADEQLSWELTDAYNQLMDELKNDASEVNPELAAEAQAKFDCWLSAAASGQTSTARECRTRFNKTMVALRDCRGGKIVKSPSKAQAIAVAQGGGTTTTVQDAQNVRRVSETMFVDTSARRADAPDYYPDTRNMAAVARAGGNRAREGVIIVNSVNVPEHLINPVPVQPMVFNQNIYGGDKTMTNSHNNNGNDSSTRECRYAADGKTECKMTTNVIMPAQNNATNQNNAADNNPSAQSRGQAPVAVAIAVAEEPERGEPQMVPVISDDLVTREEFVEMMMAMRAELQAINARLDKIQAAQNDKTMIKVQQIPLEPTQHIMEEVFEIHFDLDKAVIKPEYQELIQKLADATQSNKNIKVSVVGHTDTSGSANYNYALGGRRAEAVQNLLIKYGIPASQIVAVSAGEQDLAVPTPDGVPNAENRRVRVVKETYSTEMTPGAPVMIEVGEE